MDLNWLYIEGNLGMVFGNQSGGVNWEGYGFSVAGVGWAVANGYQKTNENGVMVSLFPIEDEEIFRQSVGVFLDQLAQLRSQVDASALPPWQQIPGDQQIRVVTQEECDAIHARLVALEAARQEEEALTPTEEDIYKAQQLLLLTEINNKLSADTADEGGKS